MSILMAIFGAMVLAFSSFVVAEEECKYDTQCKGERICVKGECVAPTQPGSAEMPSGLTSIRFDGLYWASSRTSSGAVFTNFFHFLQDGRVYEGESMGKPEETTTAANVKKVLSRIDKEDSESYFSKGSYKIREGKITFSIIQHQGKDGWDNRRVDYEGTIREDNTLLLNFYSTYNHSKGFQTYEFVESGMDSNRQNQIKIIRLKLDNILKSKIIKESPAYNIPKGHEQIVEDSVKIVHTVTTTDASSLEGTVKLNWGFIQAGIRSEVQKSTSKSDAVESLVKRSVKIIGDGQAVKVIWSELYRTGTAEVKVDGKTAHIPFEYKEDFDLSLKTME